jgi:predicted TPR repeat methyltransferase
MTMRKATDVFSDWAKIGKDEGMEKGHYPSVSAMIELAMPHLKDGFTAIDIGCGNGWVVRLLSEMGASHSEGVDGASEMIAKAKHIDSESKYSLAHLPGWKPERKFDFIHTMEFLYYLSKPEIFLEEIVTDWIAEGGVFVAGVDHYLENEDSLSWPEHVGVHMTTYSIDQWKNHMINAGFTDVEIHQVAGSENFPGTLVMIGRAGDL